MITVLTKGGVIGLLPASLPHDDDTAAELRRGGIDHLELPVNEPFLHRLRGFLRKRDSLGRGTR